MADIQNIFLSRKCKVCGKSIGKGKQYCEPCRIDAIKKRNIKVKPETLVKQCICCGKEYTTDSVIGKNKKYCSINCRNLFWRKNNPDTYKESKLKYEENIKQQLKNERKENPFYAMKDFFLIEFKKCQCCGISFIDRSIKLNVESCTKCRNDKYRRESIEKQKMKFKERSIIKGRERICCTCGVLFSPLFGHGKQLRSTCSNECHELFVKECKNDQKSRRRHVFRVINKQSQILHGDKARFKRIEIYERDRWICKLCGKKVNKNLSSSDAMGATLDHIIPLSKGGLHIRENAQLAHRTCNSLKGAGSIKNEQLLLIG